MKQSGSIFWYLSGEAGNKTEINHNYARLWNLTRLWHDSQLAETCHEYKSSLKFFMPLVDHELKHTLRSSSLLTAPRTRFESWTSYTSLFSLISSSDMHIIFHINVYNFNVFTWNFSAEDCSSRWFVPAVQSSGLQRKSVEPKPPGSRHYGLCKNSTNRADQPDNQLLLSVIIIIPMSGGPEGLLAHHRFYEIPSRSTSVASMTHNSCL